MDAEVNPTQILRDHKAKISDVPPSHTLFVQKRVDGHYTPVHYCNSVFVTKVTDSRSQHTDSLVNITKKEVLKSMVFDFFVRRSYGRSRRRMVEQTLSEPPYITKSI